MEWISQVLKKRQYLNDLKTELTNVLPVIGDIALIVKPIGDNWFKIKRKA